MAKIVDLKQGTGNVFPRTIGEAVAVGGKLLTEAISNLDEKVSAVNDFISGEPTGTVNVAPNATNIVIGNDKKSNLSIGTNNSFYMDYKGKVTIGASDNKIEVDPEYDTIKIGNQAAPTNLISITSNGLQIGHYYNSIRIGSDYSISIGTYNGIDIDSFGKISIGSALTNDVIIGTTYNNIKLGSDCSITIGTYDAIKIDPFGKVTFGPNSGVSIGGGGGSSSDLDITSGSTMSIGANTPSNINIGTASLNSIRQYAKTIHISNDPNVSSSVINMTTSSGIQMVNIRGIYLDSPEVFVGNGKHQIKLGSDNNLTIGYNDAIKINTEGKITFSENSGVPINTDNTVKLSKVTPSGDLQHYMYEQIGAIYNDTGSDIVRDAPWADLVDDDNPDDKYVTHKAGYWYMNGLGDLTNDDMRNILVYGLNIDSANRFQSNKRLRTLYSITNSIPSYSSYTYSSTILESIITILVLNNNGTANKCYYSTALKYMNQCVFNSVTSISSNMFAYCTALQYIKLINLKANIDLRWSPLLSVKSVLYMINNAQTVNNFTITLHDDVYARALQNGDILVALEAKPNITLASASGEQFNGTTTTSTTTPQS